MNKNIVLLLSVAFISVSMTFIGISLPIALVSVGLLFLYGFLSYLEHVTKPDIEAEIKELLRQRDVRFEEFIRLNSDELSKIKGRLGTMDLAKHSSSSSKEAFKF